MKVELHLETDDPVVAIMALQQLNTVLMVGNPDGYTKWSNLHNYVEKGNRTPIGQFRIT